MSLFNAETAPDASDQERLLLLKITRILNDARAGSAPISVGSGSGLPYGAVKYVVAYYGSTNNIRSISYYGDGDALIATRRLTYAGGGASDNDQLISSEDV